MAKGISQEPMNCSNRNNNISFKPLAREHIEAIVNKIERVVHFEPWSFEMFEDEVNHPLGFSWVVCTGEEVVGYICARIVEDVVEISNIAVRPDFQRRGIGSRLLSWVIDRALKERGVRRAILEVRASNEVALRLYTRYGFTVVGERDGYYLTPNGREKALLMELELDKLQQ